jgi:hypothetical protein
MIRLHPPHVAVERATGLPARPLQDTSPWWRWRRRRACRRAGGHWWHPADAMIAWFCCQCGTDRDGMPRDGSR